MELPADVMERLRRDRPFYAEKVLRVVNEDGDLVPLKYRPAQMKVARVAEAQRRAGLPVRIIVLKSRKTGVSTMVQGWLVQDTTLQSNRRGLVVAQDTDTAGELHDIGYVMWTQLGLEEPGDVPELKPKLSAIRRSEGEKFMHFGTMSKNAQDRGDLGLNSFLRIDTAKSVEAGRGKTISHLHLSEAAFWENNMGARTAQAGRGKAARKALAVINAVPDRPGTVVVVESTANGHNFFKGRWDRAERGDGGFVAVFIGWPEDENCWRAFPDPDERARFIEQIGKGEYGADEQRLIDVYGCTPEQLYWRRTTIVDKADGDLNSFRQEYPSFAAEAFVASGRHVFSVAMIQRARDRADRFDPQDQAVREPRDDGVLVPPARGVIVASGTRRRDLARRSVDVPTGGLWVPEEKTGFSLDHPFWTVWEHPVKGEIVDEGGELVKRDRQYIVFCDPARGQENATGEADYSAIQVIDHRTLEQVGVYRSKLDPDLIAEQILLAGHYWNEALVAVEVTDGAGIAIVKTHLRLDFGYRRLYQRETAETNPDRDASENLGWSTNRQTKPQMEEGMAALLREQTHGIRHRLTALELTTYVDHGTAHGADTEAHDDLLMAYMGAQEVARRTPLRRFVGRSGGRKLSSLPRSVGLRP